MFVVFSPGSRFIQALLIAFGGGSLIGGSVYRPHVLWFAFVVGAVVCLFAGWLALTAIRWWWAGVRIYYGGPRR